MSPQRIRTITWVALTLLASAVAAVPTAPELRRLFPREADLFAPRPGLARLALPPEVLKDCRPDLSDLRVFDRQDREIPFLVDSGIDVDEVREVKQTVAARILDVEREQSADGSATSERYEITAPPAPSEEGLWDLVVDTSRPEFVRTVTVSAIRADGVSVPLIEQAPLFRLRNAPGRLRVTLPSVAAERLSVTVAGSEGFLLEPTFRFENVRRLEGGARLVAPLEELSRSSMGGQTVIELARPSGLVPDLVRVTTSTPSFRRSLTVWDLGPVARAVQIGAGTVTRVAVREGVEETEVRVNPARGERLRVVIGDQGSPPLADLKLSAVVRQPTLMFFLTAADAERPAGVLRFGGGRVDRPRYDLAALLPPQRLLSGQPAEIAARLHDPREFAEARLGSIRANALFDRTPALAFAMRPGAKIDAGAFLYRRALRVTPSPDGLARLRLRAADLARTRADLGDVRVVDGEARQWPYLLARDTGADWVGLAIESRQHDHGETRYTFKLPEAPLRADEVVVEIEAPFFHRPYRLVSLDANGRESTLARGQLVRSARDPSPAVITTTTVPVYGLALVVEDGDDAPLPVSSARARIPVADLFVAAPAGQYFLLLGNADEQAPHYELAAVRDVVLAVSSSAVAAGAVEKNPAYNLRARLATGERPKQLVQQAVLWIVLALAVGVLTLVTVRLVRRGSEETKDG